jgi:hypothetical protein
MLSSATPGSQFTNSTESASLDQYAGSHTLATHTRDTTTPCTACCALDMLFWVRALAQDDHVSHESCRKLIY